MAGLRRFRHRARHFHLLKNVVFFGFPPCWVLKGHLSLLATSQSSRSGGAGGHRGARQRGLGRGGLAGLLGAAGPPAPRLRFANRRSGSVLPLGRPRRREGKKTQPRGIFRGWMALLEGSFTTELEIGFCLWDFLGRPRIWLKKAPRVWHFGFCGCQKGENLRPHSNVKKNVAPGFKGMVLSLYWKYGFAFGTSWGAQNLAVAQNMSTQDGVCAKPAQP